MNNWIEIRPNNWTYQLKCPGCGFTYQPGSFEDGTTDIPYRYCPKCGKRLLEPKESNESN